MRAGLPAAMAITVVMTMTMIMMPIVPRPSGTHRIVAPA
jgi:hypothetical protein